MRNFLFVKQDRNLHFCHPFCKFIKKLCFSVNVYSFNTFTYCLLCFILGIKDTRKKVSTLEETTAQKGRQKNLAQCDKFHKSTCLVQAVEQGWGMRLQEAF